MIYILGLGTAVL